MKKPTMKAPVKKGSKRVKRFDDGGYTGNDEIVKYRMGQIKDPGVDLFKLVRGEEQVAKPIPLDKKQTPVESKEEPKTEYKEDLSGETTKDLDPYDAASKTPVSISKPNFGGKTSVKTPVKVEKTTVTKVEPNAKPAPITNKDVDRLKEIDRPLEDVHPEDYIPGAGSLTGLLRKGLRSLGSKAAKDISPKPTQIGKDVERITVDKKQITYDPKKLGYTKKQLEMDKSGQANRASSSGAMKDDFKPDDLRSDFKKGGKIKKMASGGGVRSASSRADGCAIRGKTRA